MASCGTETGNPGDLEPDDNVNTLTEEQTVASVEVSGHLGEIAEIASEWSEASALNLDGGGSGSLSLTTEEPAPQTVSLSFQKQASKAGVGTRMQATSPNKERAASRALNPVECQEVDNNAVVSQTRSIDLQRSVVYRKETLQLKVTGSVANTHTFSRQDGQSISCGAGGRLPVLKKEDYSQITIASVIDTSKKQELLDRSGERTVRTVEQTRAGSRSISFSLESTGDGSLKVTRTATGSMTQKSVRSADRNTKEVSSNFTIPDDAPVVVVTHRTGLGPWTQKVVESGKLVSVTKEGFQVTTTVSGLTFERSNGCVPTAGSVSGVITPLEGSSVKAANYTVVYADGSAYLTFDDGKTFEELAVDTCTD